MGRGLNSPALFNTKIMTILTLTVDNLANISSAVSVLAFGILVFRIGRNMANKL